MDRQLAKRKFEVGQAVYAKIKGYPPWPAIISHFPKNRNLAHVVYFNSGKWNDLSIERLTPFHAGAEIVAKYLNKNQGFTKAYREMLLTMTAVKNNNEEKNTKNTKTPIVLLRKLTPNEIKQIKKDLKTKKPDKYRLRSGRNY